MGGIFNKLDNLVQETMMTDESFDLSEKQISVVHTYLSHLYNRAHIIVRNHIESSTDHSISVNESDRNLVANYLIELYGKADAWNASIKNNSKYSNSENESEEYFPAPAITVTLDNSHFSVTKHINGIPQKGFENTFGFQPKASNLVEKARVMSAKGGRKEPNKIEDVKFKAESKGK